MEPYFHPQIAALHLKHPISLQKFLNRLNNFNK